MDEQKNNYQGPAEQPVHDAGRDERPPQEQRPYVGGPLPDQRGYVHHDDYASWASHQYAPGPGVTPGGYQQKKPSCRWHVFFAVLLTASITFLVTVGVGYVLFGNSIRNGDPVVTKPSGTAITSPATEPVANGDFGILLSQDGLSVTFADQEGVKDAVAKFVMVYNLLQDNYYQEFTDSEMLGKIIEGLTKQMGSPYTFYLTPEYYESIEDSMRGEYVGIGAIVMRDQSDRYIVNDLIPGGPAEKGGLHVGDVFLKIDGVDVSTFEDVTQLAAVVRGEAGTDVTLIVFRASTNEELTLKLTRESITNVSVRPRMLDGKIGYIQVTEFSGNVAKNFGLAVNDLLGQGAKSFIFDLRNNGGGYAHECIDMLDVLLPPLEVASLKGRENGKEFTEVWKTEDDAAIPEDMKIVILLNENSASASELFTGVLRDYERAVIVGKKSFGKGVGTITMQLPDKSAVQVTNFAYYLPKGSSVEGVGIEPDYVVEIPVSASGKPISSMTPEEDTQLSKAIELLRP